MRIARCFPQLVSRQMINSQDIE